RQAQQPPAGRAAGGRQRTPFGATWRTIRWRHSPELRTDGGKWPSHRGQGRVLAGRKRRNRPQQLFHRLQEGVRSRRGSQPACVQTTSGGGSAASDARASEIPPVYLELVRGAAEPTLILAAVHVRDPNRRNRPERPRDVAGRRASSMWFGY